MKFIRMVSLFVAAVSVVSVSVGALAGNGSIGSAGSGNGPAANAVLGDIEYNFSRPDRDGKHYPAKLTSYWDPNNAELKSEIQANSCLRAAVESLDVLMRNRQVKAKLTAYARIYRAPQPKEFALRLSFFEQTPTSAQAILLTVQPVVPYGGDLGWGRYGLEGFASLTVREKCTISPEELISAIDIQSQSEPRDLSWLGSQLVERGVVKIPRRK